MTGLHLSNPKPSVDENFVLAEVRTWLTDEARSGADGRAQAFSAEVGCATGRRPCNSCSFDRRGWPRYQRAERASQTHQAPRLREKPGLRGSS